MHKLTVTLLCLVVGYVSPVFTQDKKVMTHEEMWAMKRVGAPALSPDGKFVVFSVGEVTYNDKENVNDIWIAATDKSTPPRRLTANKAGESAYAWSPDGKHLAFVAKRDGEEESQIYLLNVKEGGEAHKFTSVLSGASGPKWSPDGKTILFSSTVYPGCYVDSLQKKAVESKKNLKYKARVYESFPIRNWDKWLDEKQVHPFVQHIDSTQANNLFAVSKISDTPGFKFAGADWAGNGDIVLTATSDDNTAAFQYPTTHLYTLNIASGAIKMVSDGKTDFSGAAVSKDGKYVFGLISINDYSIYQMSKLTRYDWPTMKNAVDFSASLDRPVNNFKIVDNMVYASVEDKGRDLLYKWSILSSKPDRVTKGETGCYSQFSVAGNTVVSSYETTVQPVEVVKINTDGSHEFITSFNQERLSKLDLKAPETFWTKTSRGKNIRSMLVRPANFDPGKKYPLFVLMHGGPAISYKESFGYRWNYHVLAGTEYVLVLTDYTGSTGYGEKFTKDIQYDPFKGPAEEIGEAAADAVKRFSFIDGSNQAAGGASYGGHLANWMQASTTHYKCLISHAGAVNFVSQWGTSDYIYGREVMNGGAPWTKTKTWQEQNPYLYAANFKTPMLLTVGELDYRVPINNTIENWHIHQRLKVPSKLIVFPEENHWILKAENSKFHYKEIREWLGKYLMK
ncbi:MAG: S9 family peptidase [Saprospiraceae bacterium]|nr:S9 family peptidase [Saprospiraceae bacterium]